MEPPQHDLFVKRYVDRIGFFWPHDTLFEVGDILSFSSCQQFLESVLGYLESTQKFVVFELSRGCLALIRGRVARVDEKSIFHYGGDCLHDGLSPIPGNSHHLDYYIF